MTRFAVVAAAALAAWSMVASARADVLVSINKASQSMTVSVNGMPQYTWQVSTGRGSYGTPTGSYRLQSLARMHYSSKYYNSPMPHSIFFYHGFAIHGTHDISRLGGPASHGCVRLHPENAAVLFSLVRREGVDSTRIEIQ